MEPDQIKDFMRSTRWNRNNAVAYDAYRRLSRRDGWKRFLARTLAPTPPGAKVLEVGSGTGFITSILAELGFLVEGLDLSEDMLAMARNNLEREGLASRVSLAQGDAEALAFSDNQFDIVVSRWVLWTLPRPAVALAEMARILKPGGTAVLIDGRRLKPGAFGLFRSNLLNWALTGRRPGWEGPEYAKVQDALPHFTPDRTAAAFRANGLEIKEVREGLESETDGGFYSWLSGGAWSSYVVKAVKPA
ncbi:MAG: class I SAM-dependent methyltransferase [Pseudomonadota bacterium]